MAMNSPRWTAITESQFPSEREVLEWLRGHLPNHGSWHAWTNFEFVEMKARSRTSSASPAHGSFAALLAHGGERLSGLRRVAPELPSRSRTLPQL